MGEYILVDKERNADAGKTIMFWQALCTAAVIVMLILSILCGILCGLYFTADKTTGQATEEVKKTKMEIIVGEAVRLMNAGKKYIEGQFDCSKFMQTIFAKAGIIIPRVSTDQYKFAQDNPQIEELQAILGFDTGWIARAPNHTGLAINDSLFIHNTKSENIHISNYTKGYWNDKLYNPKSLKNRSRKLFNFAIDGLLKGEF